MVCVRGGVVLLLTLLVVEGPRQLHTRACNVKRITAVDSYF